MSTSEALFRWLALASIAANLWQWIRSEHKRRRGARYTGTVPLDRFPDWRVHAPQLTRRQAE